MAHERIPSRESAFSRGGARRAAISVLAKLALPAGPEAQAEEEEGSEEGEGAGPLPGATPAGRPEERLAGEEFRPLILLRALLRIGLALGLRPRISKLPIWCSEVGVLTIRSVGMREG